MKFKWKLYMTNLVYQNKGMINYATICKFHKPRGRGFLCAEA